MLLGIRLSKRRIWIWGTLAFALLVGGFIWGKQAGFIGGDVGVEVDTIRVVRRTIVERISASGDMYPQEEVNVAADVSGEIVNIFVKEGDSVSAGDLLVHIRSDNFETALARQRAALSRSIAQLARMKGRLVSEEATLRQIKQNYERQRQLLAQQVASKAVFEQAEARYVERQQSVEAARLQIKEQEYTIQSQRASVREAQENLRLTKIYAPIKGRVTRLLSKKGERVVGTQQMSGTQILSVADLNHMEARVPVIENDVIRIALKDSAYIDLESFDYLGYRLKGYVSAVATSARLKTSAESVTEYEIKVRIKPESMDRLRLMTRQKHPIRPGMTASVEIFTDRQEAAVAVPLAAVVMRDFKDEMRAGGRAKIADQTGRTPQRAYTIDDHKKHAYDQRHEVVFVFDKKEKKAQMKIVKTGINDLDYMEIKTGLKPNMTVISGPFLALSRHLEDQTPVVVRKPDSQKQSKKKRR